MYRSPYVLSKRDEGDVEDEHADRTNVVLDNSPSVVFAANRIATLPPVVEGQSCAPYDRDSHDMVQAECWEIVHVCPDSIVHIVEGGNDAPQPVYLRVVLVDLGNDKDPGREKQRNRKRRDERVRSEIDLLQSLQVGDMRSYSVGKVVKLRQERLDSLAEISTFRKSLHERQRRINEGTRVGHGGIYSIERGDEQRVHFCVMFVVVER